MLFSFAACGGDNGGNGGAQTVVGNWECIVDASSLYSQMFGMDVGKCEMRLTFDFAENGDAAVAYDMEFFKTQVPGLIDSLVNGMCEQAGMDVATYYSMAGMTRDQLIAQTETQLAQSMGSMNFDGTYEIEGDKLWILTNGQTKDDADPVSFSFDGGKLLLTTADDADVPEALSGLLPMTLTRI